MILHLLTTSAWAEANAAGEIRDPSLDTEGFIHCSDPGTLHLPAQRLFPGRTDLVVAQVDPARLHDVEVRWEPGTGESPDGPWFPHVFGPIPVRAVVAVQPFRPGADGRFAPVQPRS